MKANFPKGMGGGSGNMNQLMQQAQKMQEQLAVVEDELLKTEHQISSGGGLVSLTINGGYEISRLSIDPSVVDKDDIDLLCDLVCEAVNSACRKVTDYSTEQKEKLGLNI